MAKQIIYGEEARKAIERGVLTLTRFQLQNYAIYGK